MKTITINHLSKPIQARVKIPGSKSYTNRALFIASLCEKPVKIVNPLTSDDTKVMTECLKKIKQGSQTKLDCNLSGTTLRFLLALSAITKGTQILYGKEGLNKRPIGDLVNALIQMGAKIEYLDKKGYPPVKVSSAKLHPGIVKINGSISSQFISALLMIAPLIGEVTIEITGRQISKPYIDMTIDSMKQFGVAVINKDYKKYTISTGQKYSAKKITIEGDLSSAAYFAAIAVLTKSTISLVATNSNSKQADLRFFKILEDMGNKIVYGQSQITVFGGVIKPVSVDMADCPDQIQTLAVLAAFAKGITKISGIKSLRIKETDRVFALTQELKKMGIKTSVTKNTITIYGGNPKATQIKTYGDHRMAMAFSVAGSRLEGMEIVDPDVINKTFPSYWKKLKSIGINIKNVRSKNIVLIGMRGSGKTVVAKLLAQKLNRQCVDLDELIVKNTGLTISEIVKKYGWDFFRNKESEIVKNISSNSNQIISTGGGVILRKENIKALRKNGFLIFLNASLETLIERVGQKIGHNPKMPPLTNKKNTKEEIKEILKQRDKLYRNAADEIIDTDDLNVEEISDLIISKLKEFKVCMIIGNPVKQSLSSVMHNAGYKTLGINNQFIFITKHVAKQELKSVLSKTKTSNIIGISVTVPHKQNVMKYLDKIDKKAEIIGAVNTIVNNNGVLTGFNTDYIGALTALENRIKLKGKTAAVIGAGGAARAIVYGLIKKGSKVKVFNRSLEKAKSLAREFSCNFGSINNLQDVQNMDIVINATSVGMNDNISPVDKKFLNKNQIVFDVVYSPKETKLIRDAKSKGAQIVYGYEMLLYQGITQFELYTGMKAPVEIMKKTLENYEY